MDALKTQLLRIQEQLSGLSASQKMLTASLVAIMVMTILWWGRYAGTAEMEPVLDQPLAPADVGQIKIALATQGIPATVVGDRVMVPSTRKFEALAALAYNNNLPSNSNAAWDEMLKQSTLWDSSSKTALLQKHMMERLLSDWMTAHFQGVARANVFINSANERRLSGSLEPSASVLITTRGTETNTKRLVKAAATSVASAVSGLSPSRVAVIVNGQSYHVPDNGTDFSGEADEKAQAWEKSKTETLERMFPERSLVAVAVDVEMTRKMEQIESYNKQNSIITENEIETKTQTSNQPEPTPADPGLVSNTELAIRASASSGASSNIDNSRASMTILPGKTQQKIDTPAGKTTVYSTAIRIPRSYFVRRLKTPDSAAKEPDDAVIQELFNKELPGWVKTARDAIGMKSEQNISIDMYFDADNPMMAGVTESGGGGAGIGSMVGSHIREVAVGSLAVVSLFMLMTIVKKGTPAPIIPVEPAPRETPRLASGEDVAGIVGDNNAMLDGMEMDESAVKAQQMVDQVSTMVKENPDAAANLLKRWLNRA